MIFQESLEVAATGVELPLGHADDQRLCEFEEAAAFSTAVDRQLGACAVWLEPLVDFEEERPSGGRGGQLLVLDESRARGRRFVASAQERAHMDHCAAHFERVFAGPLHFQQSRSPQRGLGDVPHRCENVLDGAVDDRYDLKFIHFSSDLCPFLLSLPTVPAPEQSRKGTGTRDASSGSRTRCGQAAPTCPRFWFAELTTRKLRRYAHRTVTKLETDIRKWITEWNKKPRPFVWTKTADEILESLAAYCQRISDSGH
jgi:hypothetical protein